MDVSDTNMKKIFRYFNVKLSIRLNIFLNKFSMESSTVATVARTMITIVKNAIEEIVYRVESSKANVIRASKD